MTGTTSSPTRGFAFGPGATQAVVEPGPGLNVTITVQAAVDIERMHIVEGEPQGAWRLYSPGQSFDVSEGERVLLRPRGAGGGGVTFAWSER